MLARTLTSFFVDDDTALLVDLQALGGGLDQGVGGGTQRHDDSVHIQLELAALLLHGTAAAGGMLIGTFVGIFLIPGLYVIFESLATYFKKRKEKEQIKEDEYVY